MRVGSARRLEAVESRVQRLDRVQLQGRHQAHVQPRRARVLGFDQQRQDKEVRMRRRLNAVPSALEHLVAQPSPLVLPFFNASARASLSSAPTSKGSVTGEAAGAAVSKRKTASWYASGCFYCGAPQLERQRPAAVSEALQEGGIGEALAVVSLGRAHRLVPDDLVVDERNSHGPASVRQRPVSAAGRANACARRRTPLALRVHPYEVQSVGLLRKCRMASCTISRRLISTEPL